MTPVATARQYENQGISALREQLRLQQDHIDQLTQLVSKLINMDDKHRHQPAQAAFGEAVSQVQQSMTGKVATAVQQLESIVCRSK